MKSILKILVLNVILILACSEVSAMESEFKKMTLSPRSSSISSSSKEDKYLSSDDQVNNGYVTKNEIKAFFTTSQIDVNEQDKNGETWLHWAVRQDDCFFVQALVELGAWVNFKNKSGKKPIDIVVADVGILLYLQSNEKLLFAAEESVVGLIQSALDEGAFINVRNYKGQTPLIVALDQVGLEDEIIEMVTILINAHADLNLQDFDGKTALHLTALQGYGQVKQLIIKASQAEKIKA